MIQKDSNKQAYISPAIRVINAELDARLMSTSFPNSGGHNKGLDDSDELNAKQGFADDEENASQQWDS